MKTVKNVLFGLLSGVVLLGFASGCGGGGGDSSTPAGVTARLISIEVSPTNPSLALGTTKQFAATGIYSNNTRQDLTASVVWSSSTPSFASISGTGVATAVAAGTATITAKSGFVTGSTKLTVTSATLVVIGVSPAGPGIALNTSVQFTATGVFSDTTTQDLTTSVTWTSSGGSIASISNAAGTKGLATALSAGSTVVSAISGTFSGSSRLTVTPATLVAIGVSPAAPSIALGTTRQFTAIGVFSDDTTQDLTAYVNWSSSATGIATISNAAGSNGKATAAAAGSTVITATLLGHSGTTTLTVTPATLVSIGVSPTNPSTAIGVARQFTAIGVYSDNTTQDLTAAVTWSSSVTARATIGNTAGSSGFATAIAAGTTTIRAALGTVSGSTTLTVTSAALVSIDLSPTNPVVARGTTRQLTATGVFDNNTTEDLTALVTWNSSTLGVAAISNAPDTKGLATAGATGTAIITATLGGTSGITILTVPPATLVSIGVSPARPGIALGMAKQFVATGVFDDDTTEDITDSVTWTSTVGSVAAISNSAGSHGLATSLAAGSTTIRAKLGSVSGSTTLTVTSATLAAIAVSPPNPLMATGTIQQFIATGIYSDLTTQDLTAAVAWSSSGASVASISNSDGSNGIATGLAAGSTTIKAALGTLSGSTTLTVEAATLDIIDVTPVLPGIALGTVQQFNAMGTYSDNTTADLTALVTWNSSSLGIASISNAAGSSGLATSVGAGTATITATYSGVSGTTDLTVAAISLVAIEVLPIDPVTAGSIPQQFSATGVYSDGSAQDVTALALWSSSNTAVADISNAAGTNGLATPVAGVSGSSVITATLDGFSGTSTLTVNNVTLSSIAVSSATSTIARGTAEQFVAIGTFSDASTQDVTANVLWNSSNAAVATISNAAGSNGLATGVAAGTTTITAVMGSITSNAVPLAVTTATLNTITVTPASPTANIGAPMQFTATGNFSDGSTQDLTSQVTWRSATKSVASISNAKSTKGMATPLRTGTSLISATFPGTAKTGSTTLTVAAGTLTSIDVTPASPSINIGQTQQFTAIGHYTTGDQNLTKSASLTWTSSNNAVATITNKPVKNKGLAKGVGSGTSTISVKMKGFSGTINAASLTVN